MKVMFTVAMLEQTMRNGAMGREGEKKKGLLTSRFVFRVGFDCAFSSSDSDALERRLGSGLLLRHPQVSNQNSKRADTINPNEKWSTPGAAPLPTGKILHLHPPPSTFLFWSTLPPGGPFRSLSLSPTPMIQNPHPISYPSTHTQLSNGLC